MILTLSPDNRSQPESLPSFPSNFISPFQRLILKQKKISLGQTNTIVVETQHWSRLIGLSESITNSPSPRQTWRGTFSRVLFPDRPYKGLQVEALGTVTLSIQESPATSEGFPLYWCCHTQVFPLCLLVKQRFPIIVMSKFCADFFSSSVFCILLLH